DADGLGGCSGGLRLLGGLLRGAGHSLTIGLRLSLLVLRDDTDKGFSLFRFEGSVLRDAAEQGIDPSAHFRLLGPLAVQRFLEDIDGLEANVDDGRRRLDFPIPDAADQILNAMRNTPEALEADLRRGTLDGVNRAEKLVDFVGVIVAFERDEAVADDLQVLFGFGLEELENF